MADEPTAGPMPELELEAVAEPTWNGPLLRATALVAGYVPGVDILNDCVSAGFTPAIGSSSMISFGSAIIERAISSSLR